MVQYGGAMGRSNKSKLVPSIGRRHNRLGDCLHIIFVQQFSTGGSVSTIYICITRNTSYLLERVARARASQEAAYTLSLEVTSTKKLKLVSDSKLITIIS